MKKHNIKMVYNELVEYIEHNVITKKYDFDFSYIESELPCTQSELKTFNSILNKKNIEIDVAQFNHKIDYLDTINHLDLYYSELEQYRNDLLDSVIYAIEIK